MLHRFTRKAATAVAVLGAGALTLMAVTPAHASTATAQSCLASPTVYGFHGMEEGPSSTVSADSPELTSFVTDLGNNDTARVGYYFEQVPYPTLQEAVWGKGDFEVNVFPYLNDGESALQAKVSTWLDEACKSYQDQISLVGYSMGAWVIQKWLVDHSTEWKYIRTVVLYGDPCWTDHSEDGGLVRLFGGSYGCGPASTYPAPAASVPFQEFSYSLGKDPVTGYGWHGALLINRAEQLKAAVTCNSSACSHRDYAGTAVMNDGAALMAHRL
jgi:hypothetical protein